MSPKEAAQAFFGQDDASFAETVAMLAQNDPRLAQVFQNTRRRFLQDESQSAAG
jgi:hypothetical protein